MSKRRGKTVRNGVLALILVLVAYALSGFTAVTSRGMLWQGARSALVDAPEYLYGYRYPEASHCRITFGRKGDEIVRVLYYRFTFRRLLAGADVVRAEDGVACFRDQDEVVAVGDFRNAQTVTIRFTLDGTEYQATGKRENRHAVRFAMGEGFEDRAADEMERLECAVLTAELTLSGSGGTQTLDCTYQ